MGRDSIAQGALALGNESKYRPSPEGARFRQPHAHCNDKGISPRWGFTYMSPTQPRADAPWAVESRPLGAEPATSSPKKVQFREQFWLLFLRLYLSQNHRSFMRSVTIGRAVSIRIRKRHSHSPSTGASQK